MRKKILIICLIIILLMIGFFTYQWWQTKEQFKKPIKQKQAEELKDFEKEVIDEIADWKVYRNINQGFEIKYPHIAFFYAEGNAIDIEIDEESLWPPQKEMPEGWDWERHRELMWTASLKIEVIDNPLKLSAKKWAKEWIDKLDAESIQQLKKDCEKEKGKGAFEKGECPSASFADYIHKREEIVINEIPAYKISVFEFDHHKANVFLAKDKFIYKITFDDKENPNDPNTEIHYKINFQILNSFKFIE
ncbi:hypothetical protein L6248_00460 [Candidatus Parcubacteria bacterium]|nr:hypothetical protein [Candidatus Parcubacteria bacterium]MCG2700906.1 hypothetical protein [Candidatus Parcubacteria bacterium]